MNEHNLQLVARAKAVHGDVYEYPIDEWPDKTKMIDKVKIICPEHGPWFTRLNGHINGKAKCRKCIGTAPLTRDERILQARATHGDKYDYSLFPDKVRANSNVKIICPIHGEFKQSLSAHVHGQGCKQCNCGKFRTVLEWVDDFKTIHGCKYLYPIERWPDKVISHTEITVYCKQHGIFKTTPAFHYHHKRGCSKCSGNAIKTKKEWIDDFISIHGNKYDYSLLPDNIRSDVHIRIVCSEHGSFLQRPDNHLGGNGCPTCSFGEQNYMYINTVGDSCIKYGITGNLNRRIKQQTCKSPLNIKNIYLFKFEDSDLCKQVECLLKAKYTPVLSRKDLPDGFTETTFSYNLDEIVSVIKEFGGVRL